jgi:chromosome segregation ATPase
MSIQTVIRSISVAINLDKLTQLFSIATGATKKIAELTQKVAELQTELAEAKANDKSDADAIAEAQSLAETAKAEAEAAKQALAPLQAAVDADASEDEKVNALLDGFAFPVETPAADPVE